jgi:hypothetical protein
MGAEAPTFGPAPATQDSTVNRAIAPVVVKGSNLTTVTAKELPLGLTPIKVSESEWKIEGTPTTVKGAVTVTLEATNSEGAATPATFKWKVEAAPTFEALPAQDSTANRAISPVLVKGSDLATVTAKELPAGLVISKVSESEWKIEGTPSTVSAVVTVTLEATNKATNAPGTATATLEWTVEAAPTLVKPGDQNSTANVAITPIAVQGSDLATVTAKELPPGLKLRKVSEVEWVIEGTPTAPEAISAVVLEAVNTAGGASAPVGFTWSIGESVPAIEKPANQASTTGTAITALIVKGSNLATLTANELPQGLALTKVSETEWMITGTPTTPKAATIVTLEASNKEKAQAVATATLVWTIAETVVPVSPIITPTPVVPLPITKAASAGQLGTVPVQKPGTSLTASFRCEVAACRVVITATVTAGKSKFKIRSSPTSIKLGQKAKIAMKLSKKQQVLIAATLKKHKKVSASVAASIESTVGLQTTKSLAITVRR